MKCECKEWKKYSEYMDGVSEFLAYRNNRINILPFIYCPYCGKTLEKETEIEYELKKMKDEIISMKLEIGKLKPICGTTACVDIPSFTWTTIE